LASSVFPSGDARYDARLASELDIYRECTDVHDLPAIFHYWSNRYVRPKLEAHGFRDPAGLFLLALAKQCAQCRNGHLRFLSVGSGNCDFEVQLAVDLRAQGFTAFTLECLDLNQAMLQRGAIHARAEGVFENLEFIEADFNRWSGTHEYDAVMANQSLHHVMELEWLFDEIHRCLRPQGIFVVSDMVGRNGHLRWPEALNIVREFWNELPPAYRCNSRTGRYEAFFQDVDCSTESFEGIRAQDIIPLLSARFHFQLFVGFGNIINPFVDRSFGPNFDASSAWDREFIDRVHLRDEQEFAAGTLQPTQMVAVLGKHPGMIFGEFTPPQVHRSSGAESATSRVQYAWDAWPHDRGLQLSKICHVLENTESLLKATEERLHELENQFATLKKEFDERTSWAGDLDRQLTGARVAWEEINRELTERTQWALDLDRELQERTAWALSLDRELHQAPKSRFDGLLKRLRLRS
jgi:SAM-dependent methyltransferase